MSDRPSVAIVVDRFPCLSESFVRGEVEVLVGSGLRVVVVSCVPQHECDPWAGWSCGATVIYGSGSAGWASPRRLPALLGRARAALPPAAGRSWRVGRSLQLALRLGPLVASHAVRHIHGHFLHRPGLIAGLLADLLGVSFSLSGHGRDVFVPEYRAAGLCRGARFVSVCSEHARAGLLSRLPEGFPTPVHYCPHGVAIGRPPSPRIRQNGAPVRLVSVCRLVRKKGVDVILRALARLQAAGLPYRYSILGEGPEAGSLAALSRELGLRNVEFRGRRSPAEVRSELLAADALVLGCRTAADGDRDGIPNVVLEAMEAMLPVIVTDAGGVSEVVRHRQTGWLVPSESPPAVAEAILELASDESLRLAVALRGRREVERHFDLWRNGGRLARLLSESAGGGTPAAESAAR